MGSSVETQEMRPVRRHWPLYVAMIFLGLVILGSASFVAVSALEEQDTFCTSCHLAPEVTYFNRAYLALDNPDEMVTDLSTAHYHAAKVNGTAAFKCIDCHRGDSSAGHRIATLALGGRDAIIYLLGRENQAIEKTDLREGWLPNASCVGCHTETLITLDGIDNHYHTYLKQAAEAAKTANPEGFKISERLKPAVDRGEFSLTAHTVDVEIRCTDCHLAHKTIPTGALNFYMEADRRNQTCITCHLTAKEGPQDIRSLSGGQ